MPSPLAYHRPGSLDEASTLLAGPNRRAVGGGTIVVPEARAAGGGVELVDLQNLALDRIEDDDGRVRIGAMVRLGDLASHRRVPELLCELARRELPSALRNQATVGGVVALAGTESVLLAGLLVHDTRVSLHGHPDIALADLVADGTGARLITAVSVDPDGSGVVAATGRTPADVPIVAAVARATADRRWLALTGVAATPVLVDPGAPTAGLDPPGDFRGSPEYRLHLAQVLSTRVLAELS
ncbi:MAG: FAD binding domain-containing protein [Acidimicrobiales bacterium]